MSEDHTTLTESTVITAIARIYALVPYIKILG